MSISTNLNFGSGSSSTYYMFDLDGQGTIKDYHKLGGGTLTEETTNPLKGKKSLKWTLDASSANGDDLLGQYITVPNQSKTTLAHKCSFRYKVNNGAGDTFKAKLLIVSGAGTETKEFILKDDVNKFETLFTIPTDVSSVRLDFEVNNAVDTAELIVDSIEFSDAAYGYGSATISETISYVGFVDVSGDYVKFKTKVKDTSSVLIADDMTNRRFIAKQKCQVVVTANLSRDPADNYLHIQVFDANGNNIINAGTDTGSSNYNDNASITLEMEKDWTVKVHSSDTNIHDSVYTSFSITATAQSDKILFEDEREQAHVVASLKLEGNDGRNISADTEAIQFSGSSPFWTAGADGSDGTNGEYYTVQSDNSRVSISISAFFTSSNTRRLQIRKNGALYRSFSQYVSDFIHYGDYISDIGEFSKGDKIAFYSAGAGGDLSNDPAHHYLTITEEYIPPVSQASTPTVLAVNASEENDYDVEASDTGVLSNFNPVNDWVTFVSKVSTGVYKYKLNEDIFKSYPDLDAFNKTSTATNVIVYEIGFPEFEVYCRDVENKVYVDRPHTIRAKKRGADRSPAKAYVVDGKQVSKKRTMQIGVNVSPYYNIDVGTSNAYEIVNLAYLKKDIFGSIANDILTLPKGKYEIVLPVAGHNNTGWLKAKIYNETASSDLEEKFDVCYSNSAKVAFSDIQFIVDLDDTTSISFWIGAGNSGYDKYAGEITIHKIE